MIFLINFGKIIQLLSLPFECLLARFVLWYSGTSNSGHSEERTTSLQWTNCVPPANNCMHVRTSKEGTTSE